jgi:hypothetical protein
MTTKWLKALRAPIIDAEDLMDLIEELLPHIFWTEDPPLYLQETNEDVYEDLPAKLLQWSLKKAPLEVFQYEDPFTITESRTFETNCVECLANPYTQELGVITSDEKTPYLEILTPSGFRNERLGDITTQLSSEDVLEKLEGIRREPFSDATSSAFDGPYYLVMKCLLRSLRSLVYESEKQCQEKDIQLPLLWRAPQPRPSKKAVIKTIEVSIESPEASLHHRPQWWNSVDLYQIAKTAQLVKSLISFQTRVIEQAYGQRLMRKHHREADPKVWKSVNVGGTQYKISNREEGTKVTFRLRKKFVERLKRDV